ncbi:MAG: hypothetical protein KGJ23_01505 [Euryarchaeota archaeon]|nr:hypothetical protein [Euryarchaeota archaeon]MDE1835271.1 hypothetical protein [Euryarchaeota archaeon]MDE1881048.1 hypothetical protein [Euryarchaeota archaeon]MDE2043567.1 hypothetical protein [Thermoplasmata archaeon]
METPGQAVSGYPRPLVPPEGFFQKAFASAPAPATPSDLRALTARLDLGGCSKFFLAQPRELGTAQDSPVYFVLDLQRRRRLTLGRDLNSEQKFAREAGARPVAKIRYANGMLVEYFARGYVLHSVGPGVDDAIGLAFTFLVSSNTKSYHPTPWDCLSFVDHQGRTFFYVPARPALASGDPASTSIRVDIQQSYLTDGAPLLLWEYDTRTKDWRFLRPDMSIVAESSELPDDGDPSMRVGRDLKMVSSDTPALLVLAQALLIRQRVAMLRGAGTGPAR